jgi:Flp pilus assembly protein TadD
MAGRLIRVLLATSLAVLVLGWATPASAQNGTLSGRVVDAERRVTDKYGQPVPGFGKLNQDKQLGLNAATVTMVLKGEPPREFKVVTDAFGEWYKSGLPPGTYDISIKLEWVDRTDMSKSPKPVVFVGTMAGVVLKPGEKRRLADIGGLTEEAVAAGRKAPVTSSLTSAEAEAANKRAAELDSLFTGANAAIAAGNYADAVAKLTAIADKTEKCGRCFVKIGEIELKRNEQPAAEAAFLKAIELDPANPDPYAQLAAMYNGLGRLPEAVKMGAKAAELMGSLGSTDPIAVYNMGVIQWNAGNVEAAKEEFAKAVKLDPKKPNAQYFLGMTTFVLASSGKGALIDAKAPLQEYLKLAPTGEYAANAKEFLASIK